MLNIYRSNRIEVLVAQLAELLKAPSQRPADPFRPLRVVVGSQGMERWLRHQLASRLEGRICANTEFPFSAQIRQEALTVMEQRAGAVEAMKDVLGAWQGYRDAVAGACGLVRYA